MSSPSPGGLALRALAENARAAWPAIGYQLDEFVADLERRELSTPTLTPERTADLYLAWACARGDAAALAAFEERFARDLSFFASQARIDAALAEDVVQDVRRHLLTAPPGATPQIAQYAGRGDLRGWLRVTVVRAAVRAGHKGRRERPGDEPLEEVVADAPDLDAILDRTSSRAAFHAAFEEAIAELTPRFRAVLRCRFVDGLSEDAVATMYGTHRVTVARWVRQAREQLLTATRRGLQARLSLHDDEVTSVVRAMRSHIGLSLRRLLGGADGAPRDPDPKP